ncbi:hypothetical protein BDF22DRAFT_775194 [Syncephalis plumigaleata]|nr:hypothetical protein BDF22DRAFT_775194 [Syncephalis plumigaleata]
MSKPPPRGSLYGPDKSHADYNLKSRSSVDVVLTGEAKHNGGHCQFSLSYDGGKTFVVIKDVLNNNAIFAWSWINATGVREYYMNCADIAIEGVSDGKVTGPKMLVANILGGPTVPEWGSGTDKVGVKLLAAQLKPSYPTTTPNTPPSPVSAPSPSPSDQAPSGDSPTPSPDADPVSPPKSSYPPSKSPETVSSPDTEPSSSHHRKRATTPTPTSSYPTTNSTTTTPQNEESSTATPAPTGTTPASTGGSCKEGEYRCVDSSQFTVCGAGGHLHTMKCALGTECVPSGNAILCDHAKKTNATKSAEYD